MIFYVVTDDGSDWLILGFSGSMFEVKLQNRKLPLFSERVSAISAATPLTIMIRDGQMTVSVGSRTRTVGNISAFKGTLTTQSIEGTLKVYQFKEQ